MNKIITQRAETVYGLLQEQLEFVWHFDTHCSY
jgi:hypothetical protein